MTEDAKSQVLRWRAIEPELTHFHDIISLDFDIASERGTSDTLVAVTTRPQRGERWPWQRVVLTFWGGPLDADHPHAVRVRCIFDGVVFFKFLQDDFLPKIDEDESRGYAAFCLWECDDSPFLDKLISRWEPWRPIEERQPWLRHFATTCNELGDFEIVARDVTIENPEGPPS